MEEEKSRRIKNGRSKDSPDESNDYDHKDSSRSKKKDSKRRREDSDSLSRRSSGSYKDNGSPDESIDSERRSYDGSSYSHYSGYDKEQYVITIN